MFNAHDQLFDFYNEKVRLSSTQQGEMRERRNSNRQRLDSGLANNGSPQKIRTLIQGSYKMKTMIQRPGNDYDIDDGAIFTRDSLKGPNGGDKSALDARQMVLEALSRDSKFKEPPKCLKNCVRVFYSEGYHIDVPVYREYEESGNTILELASSDWKESDPTLIANWFADQVKDKSPSNDNTQMRRIVCLLKKWAKSRSGWNLPNGLIFSVYAADHYSSRDGRDDEAFLETLEAIRSRLDWNKSVPNPVDPYKEDFATGRETKIENLKQKLDENLPSLINILQSPTCTKNEAMRAWASFFSDDFFMEYIDEDFSGSSAGSSLLVSATPEAAVQKQGQGRYA